MADISDLLARLKREASIEASEQFDDELDLEVDIEDALNQHNQFYTVETLPDQEIPLVMLLAWAKICYRRATKFANLTNITGGQGFASDRSTPYNKNISLARALLERYRAMVDNLGLQNAATGIVQGRLLKLDDLINQVTPRRLGVPPAIRLSVGIGESLTLGSTLVIHWDTRDYNNFASFILFATIDGSVILQNANYDSATGIPRIRDTATKVFTVSNFSVRDYQLINVNKSVINHLLVVNRSASDQYTYSNELIFGGP